MADERNLVDEEDTVKENSAQNRREKKKRDGTFEPLRKNQNGQRCDSKSREQESFGRQKKNEQNNKSIGGG